MYNVLVVEDDEDIRNLLIDQLQDKGCIARKADDWRCCVKKGERMQTRHHVCGYTDAGDARISLHIRVARKPGDLRHSHRHRIRYRYFRR